MRSDELIELLKAEVKGRPPERIEGVSPPEKPRPNTLVFCRNEEEARKALEAGALPVVEHETKLEPSLRVKSVKLALALALSRLYPEEHPTGVSPNAVVGEGTTLGRDVYLGDFVVVGKNVRIGDGVKIYPFTFIGDGTTIGDGTVIFSGVHIYPRTVIGRRVRIHSGAVIGADGFGYYVGPEGIVKLPHAGVVVIEDGVEIGANATVDRALLTETRVGRDTKVDNLVMIGHNCKVGPENLLVSQVGLSGSVETGRRVMLAGQVGVADHVKIGDGAVVTAKSGVASDLKGGKTYGANLPAIEWSRWKRIYLYILRLPELFRKLKGG
ncbi:MAG: UDP-3-O-(3-hydroxymyristoyl)glucosamine N-acyltransferase [Aquificae bacterium]|nr:UDP-3-O-(3-hydroxymyristoyl)glucosamine N-acyltransferase [Aquificota bacterium]